ncbi:hypothetical protein R3P38DRAFT_1623070 [Favolaschia claudopus]|uniref:F-box domain-containing protein n=1 Tax=Favolaschia claudopus TaxID=2862362 RepID=A0AAW0AHI7_9AGAR
MDLDQAATAAFTSTSGHLSGILPSSVSVTKVIKALIAASEEKIAQIDSQIRDLQCMRDRESGLIASLKLVISPIRKLADELLTNIIRHAGITQTVFPLSQVCKHWRQLAHRIPALWTGRLPLRLLTVSNPSPEHIAFIKAYVQRSNPLPLCFNPLGSSSNKTISPSVAEALVTGASRWVELDVGSDHSSLLEAPAKLRSEPLKMLESVKLRGCNKAQMSVSAFLRAPLLRKVTLCVAQTDKFPMPWAQVTHLELSEDDFSLWIGILLQCTNLAHAKINAEHSGEQDADTVTDDLITVTLPFLETLDLRLPTRKVASCFGRLALPKLRRLEMSLDTGNEEWSAPTSDVFSQFQDRSPNIEYISLSLCEIYSDALHSILLHSPHLTDFHLDCCRYSVDDYFLEHIQRYDLDQVHLVPRLERLLMWDVDDSWTEERLLAMIKSRWWTAKELQALSAPPPVARLERVEISRTDETGPPFSESFQREISRLKAQGLNVEVI